MSDNEVATDKTFEKEPPAKVAKKVKTAKSVGSKTTNATAKEGPSHPKYSDMIIEAIKELKLRTGCSRTAIMKQIKEVHELGDEKRATMYLSLALKKGVEKGIFKKAREEGKNSNKYKLGDNAEVKKATKKAKTSTEAKKPKSKKEGAAVFKKSASTKSKEKASAKRNSLGSPPDKSKVKKVAAAKKGTAAAAKPKAAAGKKTDKKSSAASAKKPDKKPTKAAAAKPKAGSAKKPAKKTTPGKKPKPKK